MARGGRRFFCPLSSPSATACSTRTVRSGRGASTTRAPPAGAPRCRRAPTRARRRGAGRGEQVAAQALDVGRRDHLYGVLRLNAGLSRGADRVRGQALPLHRALEHSLQQRECLAHGLDAHAVRLQFGPEPGDGLWGQVAQAHGAEARKEVLVVEVRVDLEGRALEVRAGVDGPPLLSELGERLGAGVEVREGVAALEDADLRLEGAGVVEPVEIFERWRSPAHQRTAISRVGGTACTPWTSA